MIFSRVLLVRLMVEVKIRKKLEGRVIVDGEVAHKLLRIKQCYTYDEKLCNTCLTVGNHP
jgi:hypothetical protein